MTNISVSDRKYAEFFNVLTHAPGVIIGVALLATLLAKYSDSPASHIAAYIIYGITFIMIYGISSIYHGVKSSNTRRKELLKKCDHACIFIFMGGCYTPFVIINMNESLRYWFLALVWGLVGVGIIYKFLSQYKGNFLSLALYLSFGFMSLLAKPQMLDNMPHESFMFLVYGGIAYTVGVIFYTVKKIPYHHAIWHLFVLAGSLSHFYAVYTTY